MENQLELANEAMENQTETRTLYSVIVNSLSDDRQSYVEFDDLDASIEAYAKALEAACIGETVRIEEITGECEWDDLMEEWSHPLDDPNHTIEILQEDQNRGESLEGAVIVTWYWHQHIGYARRFGRLEWGTKAKNRYGCGFTDEADIEEYASNNQSAGVVMTAEDVAKYAGDWEALAEQLMDRLLLTGDWRWNVAPKEAEIREFCGLKTVVEGEAEEIEA